MKALVTGAGEYLGSRLVKRLLDDGHEVLAIGRMPDYGWLQYDSVAWWNADLGRKDECYKMLEGVWINSPESIEWVFHLSPAPKRSCFYSDTIADFNLINAALTSRISRFLYLSSTEVYPPLFADNEPFVEDDVYPALPSSLSGWQKLNTEHLLQRYFKSYGMKTYIVRAHECYGVGMPGIATTIAQAVAREKLTHTDSRVIKGGDFNGNTISYLPSEIEIELPCHPRQTHSLMHVDDCIEGMIRLIQTDYHDPVTLGPDRAITTNTLADLIGLMAGVNVKKGYDKDDKVQNMHFSHKRCLEVLGWIPDYSLGKGIEELYQYVEKEMKDG